MWSYTEAENAWLALSRDTARPLAGEETPDLPA
jgi:hypothetical protein